MSDDRVRELFDALDELHQSPDVDFVRRLRQRVADVAAGEIAAVDAEPITEFHAAGAADAEETFMITLDGTTEHDETVTKLRSPRWGRLLAVAAAVVLLVIGGAAFILSGNGDPITTDGATQTADEYGQAAIDVAISYLDAYARADEDAVRELLADGAPIQVGILPVEPDEIGPMVGLVRAMEDDFDVTGCAVTGTVTIGEPVAVTCDSRYRNALTDAVGGDWAPYTHFLRIEDGHVAAYRGSINARIFDPIWNAYWEFIQEQHSSDFDAMFEYHPDLEGGPHGLRMTEESVELHDRYVDDFVASRADG